MAAPICFVSGTLIRTTRGDIAIQNLCVGDVVITASGGQRPLKWLGHREVDCRKHSDPRSAWPIRIRAHAFAPNEPARDLYVSPGHSIGVTCGDQVLVIASALVNGATISQIEMDRVTYWPVELDSHDVLLANGLPAESYLDMGNRSFFAEADLVALEARPDAARRSHADFCRPFVDHGPLLDEIRTRLRARAISLGWSSKDVLLTDLRLVASA